MQAGSLVGSDALTYTSRVLVNGVQRPAMTWSVDRDLTGDLPEQVVAVSGIMQATGSVEWAWDETVDDGATNPWNSSSGWLPARGDRVEIFAGDGVSEWKQFHGLIDQTSGEILGGLKSTLIDDFDKLSAEVSHSAMVSIMPPLARDGSEPYRRVGLHPLFYVDYALRRAGFFATPPREPFTNVYAPLQGTLWPAYGFLRSSVRHGLNNVAPWGLSRRDFEVTYTPILDRPMSDTTQVTLLVDAAHAGPVDVFLDYGSAAHSLRLVVDSSRIAKAYKDDAEVCRVALGAGVVISMLAKSGTISLRTDKGATASGSFAASGPLMSGIRVNASTNASVAGLQVSHPATVSAEHMSTRWTPSAVFDTSDLRLTGIITAAPTIENRRVDSLVEEINKALLCAMWIDELGAMRWAASNTLRNREASKTVTSLEDIFSLSWESGLLQSASMVKVTGKRPSITRGRWRNTLLARGTGDTIKSEDELELFMEPEPNEDWIMPGLNFIEVGGEGNIWGSYNVPSYSATGLYYTADGGTTTVAGLSCAITSDVIGMQKVLVKYSAGTWPSDVEGVLKTSPTSGGLWPKNRNEDLPRIVGAGKIKWYDSAVTANTPGGPGPELVHDTGYWANRTESAGVTQQIADYLAAQTAVPLPTINGLEVAYDPRLQLGDVIMVDSPDLLGVSIKALVVGVRNSAGTEYSQSLSVRIIEASSTYRTYEDFNRNVSGVSLTYEQWEAIGPRPQTYTQFNTDLEG